MTTALSSIGTTCPTCGPTEVTLAAATLRVRADGRGDRCVIQCDCGTKIDKLLDAAMTILLLAAGIHVELWTATGDGLTTRPISPNEIAQFRQQLLDDHELRRQVSAL